MIATPGSLATGVVLPAMGDLFVSTSAALVAPQALLEMPAVVVNGVSTQRKPGGKAGAAGTLTHVGRIGATTAIKKTAGAPGTVSLYVRDTAGALHVIAQG